MSKTILLNQNWIFSKEGHDEPVTLPHTWNAIDGQDGGNDYYRGTCCYTTVLPDIVLPENGRAVLQFDAVAMTAEVYLNEQKLAEHKGGYSAFCVDITDALRNGINLLRVNVDNSDNDTVYPQKADFTFYGGIYRDVTLHVVPAAHFALAENGAVPVRVTPIVTDLDARRCEVTVEAAVVGAESVTFTLDGQQTSVAVKDGTARAVFTLEHARLWDGISGGFEGISKRAFRLQRYAKGTWLRYFHSTADYRDEVLCGRCDCRQCHCAADRATGEAGNHAGRDRQLCENTCGCGTCLERDNASFFCTDCNERFTTSTDVPPIPATFFSSRKPAASLPCRDDFSAKH